MDRLTITDFSTGYDQVQVLQDVSLAVAPGAIVALLGPNGAGKTTLLRAIAGLGPTWGGTIQLDGRDVGPMSTAGRVRAGMCLVPSGRAIFPRLTVAENLAMHAPSARGVKDAVEAACTVFPAIRRFLKQPAGTLSGGQQQMVALSRAVIRHAPIVLADELSMGLAPVVVDEIIAALVELRRQGSSVLLVEQYVERALAVADYGYVLNRGHVALHGEPRSILESDLFETYLGATA